MKTRYLTAVLLAAIVLVTPACRQNGGRTRNTGKQPAQEAPARLSTFPMTTVPSVYGNNTDSAIEYLLEHYWDAFFKCNGATGPETILGVEDGAVEQGLANYIQMLADLKLQATPDDLTPLKQAQGSVHHFFKVLETKQLRDTSSRVYLRLTELVSKYLYDPNAPQRDEDLYLPFVQAMAESPCTRDDMRTAYRYEARMCGVNRFGETAPDFSYADIRGRKHSLHGIKADYTMLFFSNPGCTSCREIIEDVTGSRSVYALMQEGRLAILNVYIDEEVEKWRAYSRNYPSSWLNGYDYTFSLRDSGRYCIRAIPSLYLLDARKRVIIKDAPTSVVLNYLDNL